MTSRLPHPKTAPLAPPQPASWQRSWLTSAGAYVAASIVLVCAIVLSIGLGAKFIPPLEVWNALWGNGSASSVGIVGDLRWNRTWLGVIAGAALGASGILMQSLTRNPVAEPGILGVNAGASLGVVISILVFGALSPATTVWFALAGAAIAVSAIFAVTASALARGAATTVILAGVALGAVFVGISQALVLTDENVLDTFRFWNVGSLTARSLADAAPILPLLAVALLLSLGLARPMDAIALGDDAARGLGVNPAVIRIIGLFAIAASCAVATALVGPIGFIGLLAPHAARAVVGPNLTRAVILAILFGPIFVLASDILGRLIGNGAEVQVGVVAAFVGVPVLIAIVLRGRAVRA